MRHKLLLTSLILVFFCLSLASAEIILSQPESVYSLGDNLDINSVIKPDQVSSGFFELNLECSGVSKNFHKEYVNTLGAGEEKAIDSSLLLTKSFFDGDGENCAVEAKFLSEVERTTTFRISDKIDIEFNVKNLEADAGEKISFEGSAVKEDSEAVEGFAELYIAEESVDIKITKSVEGGEFSGEFSFPDNTKSGYYKLVVRVYEKSGTEITNEGEQNETVFIKQKPSRLDILTSNQNILPGNEIRFRMLIYDQAEEEMTREVGIKVYNTEEDIILQKVVNSGKEESLRIEKDSKPGYWKIEAFALNFTSKKLFYVEELETASFEIENNTLIITNTGNVVYRKPIEVYIGEHLDIKNIELGVGEKMKFRLSAPDGEYGVRVSDGKNQESFESVALTGSTIGVARTGNGLGMFLAYPVMWIFLILVLGLFIFVFSRKVIGKRFYAYPAAGLSAVKRIFGKKAEKVVEKKAGGAEHALVLDGRKEDAGIMALKIKDIGEVKKKCKDTLGKISEIVKGNKGSIYDTEDFKVVLFSPATTKTFGNELIAIRTAQEISKLLKEHNRKFKQKIEHGIGINSGKLIIKKDKDKVKFTSVGNTIALAKKIAEISDKEVLLSGDIQSKMMSSVKANKEVRKGINVYHISKIIERKDHSKFVKDFLERQAKEKKK